MTILYIKELIDPGCTINFSKNILFLFATKNRLFKISAINHGWSTYPLVNKPLIRPAISGYPGTLATPWGGPRVDSTEALRNTSDAVVWEKLLEVYYTGLLGPAGAGKLNGEFFHGEVGIMTNGKLTL